MNPTTAASYGIPSRRLVSVEHPAVVRNIDKAIETLQGNSGISKIVNPPKPDYSAKLVLRPNDDLAQPLQSTSSQANNFLLKVTVPKRTGRKRKRGSDEPFTDAVPEGPETTRRRTVKAMRRSLQDNADSYKLDLFGRIERTHVFRGMPEFVSSSTRSLFTQKFRDYIMPYKLDKLKHFDIEMTKGADVNVDIIPPPSLSHDTVPFLYMYRQNPGVKQTLDLSGEIVTWNAQRATKIRTFLVPYDIPVVPSKPQDSLPPIETLDSALRGTIDAVAAMFEERPAWTRRGVRNLLKSEEQRYLLRQAVPYIGYMFRSGPWRDAIIKLGIDPRSSPDYRHYQTLMFRLMPADQERDSGNGRRFTIPRPEKDKQELTSLEKNAELPPKTSHIFTAKLPFARDGRIWMPCDIKDPILEKIFYPPDDPNIREPHIRSTCEIIQDGWFGNGTLAKVKTIMRTKIQALVDDTELDDGDFEGLLAFPSHANDEKDIQQYFHIDPEKAPAQTIQYATEIRAMMKSAPIWRLTHEGPGSTAYNFTHQLRSEKEVEGDVDLQDPEDEEEELERADMLAESVEAAWAEAEIDNSDGNKDQDGVENGDWDLEEE
ncbi:tau 95 subunit of transcription factor TFIIIC [Penicillium taxi]|uniref:tau 95 subunit of transcription factor TFIIIC n=1 Tax=Penicillium taxi TaxID=168475 RepID=UPI002545AAFC|nr:tau 95 subunit of transcription factor TFIIIC [Penicillium taxi]KAJ5908630.1 tau 95 subunit of transcription factor TFIIIC [Penicillium taxi]